jgi:hypothetical protein
VRYIRQLFIFEEKKVIRVQPCVEFRRQDTDVRRSLEYIYIYTNVMFFLTKYTDVMLKPFTTTNESYNQYLQSSIMVTEINP